VEPIEDSQDSDQSQDPEQQEASLANEEIQVTDQLQPQLLNLSSALQSSKPQDHITVVQNWYHSVIGEDPVQVEGHFSRFLSTSEQAYTRWLKVKEAWIPIDLGWITKVGMVVIRNTGTKFTQVQPSPEQVAEAAKQVLEVSYTKDSKRSFLIPPGETYPFYPTSPEDLCIRCQHGEVRFTLWVYPG
jgi:hypothetical protein